MCPDGVPRGHRHVCVAQMLESCVDIRELHVPEECPEYNIDEVIVSLESQVDRLCSLIDTFRTEFQRQLLAFRKEIKNLPDRVGVDYTPRQRAYLLKLYGKQLVEGGDLAIHRLQQDLAHLISLDGDECPHDYPSTAPSLASSVEALETKNVVSDREPGKSSSLQLLASSLESGTWPTPARASRSHLTSSIAESVTDDHDKHDPCHDERTPDHEGEQESLPETWSIPLRPRREVAVDGDHVLER